jgi:NAD(P)-dependent dehydrogenase (short-subunit alcohol dehydrogenase family)
MKSTNHVAGKVALVTGAATGLGSTFASVLAAEGASVVVADRDVAAGQSLVQRLCAAKAKAVFIELDVAVEEQWVAALAQVKRLHSKLDVLVNNAGVIAPGELLTLSLEDWRRTMSVNLDGVFLGMKHAGALMIEGGGGSIINIASIFGKVGAGGGAPYCASKGGVTLLTKAAALEWAKFKIRVNSLHPGFIDSPSTNKLFATLPDGQAMRERIEAQHALGRFGNMEEIAQGVLFLASDASSYMTGAELVLDGGYTAA